jgi:pyruvate,water dikinase
LNNLYWLDRIQPSNLPIVGNKAFNLSQLLQRGYPVLPGFVVPARVTPALSLPASLALMRSPPEFSKSAAMKQGDSDSDSDSVSDSDSDSEERASAIATQGASERASAGRDSELTAPDELTLATPGTSADKDSVDRIQGVPGEGIAFWEFIEILGESEPLLRDLPYSSFHVDVDNPRQLQQVAQQIRHAIASAALPPTWATSLLTAAEALEASVLILHPSLSLQLQDSGIVGYTFDKRNDQWRMQNPPPKNSSFIIHHSLSPLGILESRTCRRHPDALLLSLKRVWAELFRARSLFYWQRNELDLQQLNLAVLVQPIWEAIASGTIEADRTEWKIQATWGLGEALSKGQVLPDSYRLQADTGTLLSSRLGSKTRAYRLGNEQESGSVAESGLQAYTLDEEQQKRYALEEKYLQQLIDLCQRLAAEFTPTFSLEWTLCQPPGSSEPQLYVTQFIPQTLSTSSQISMSTQPQTPSLSPQIVRGLPAAAGRVTAPAHVLIGENRNLEAILPGRILVARSISPDWLPWLKSAAGIITEQGGMTCHAAIIARELGIPAIVSAAGVTRLIQTDEFLLVDGDQGEIHRLGSTNPVETEESPTLNSQSPIPHTQYPIATQLLVNLSQPQSLERILGLPVDGVGLLRSELMMLNALENQTPDAWLRQGRSSELVTRLAQLILQFAAAFAPRPVFYRSLDWRSHELQLLSDATSPPEPEINPIVGRRGTLRYLDDPTCFDLELAALAQVQRLGYANVQLMLPFVRTVEEFTFCRRRVEQAGLTENPHFQLWIMAEVPSVLFLLPDYVEAGVQGISIGTNDLTQLLLATDRDREPLNSSLNGRHPAVQRALKQLIETARNAGIPCSICGQAPVQYPELIDLLVQWGITSISVDVNDVERTYNAIARAEQRLLLKAARQRMNE